MAEECHFCKTRKILQGFLDTIEEEIPEIGADFYDKPITDIYNAIDDAISTHRCMCDERIRE